METLDGVTLAAPVTGSPTVSSDQSFHETGLGWLTLAVVWTTCAVYLGVHLRQVWIPHDAGTLAQMANRVLHGQVPNRDFVDGYTGGLAYMNALAFRIFGTNLFSLRIPVFLFFLGWVPSVYFIARRFVGPIGAGMVTLLSVAWSVPVYPEATPSWYNLFFATWGTLVLIRYVETEKRRWILVAGLCGGLSFLAKSTGLYFFAAGLLFFVYRELSLAQQDKQDSKRGGLPYRLFASAGLIMFLVVLTSLISRRPLPGDYVQFVLPGSCLAFMLLWLVWRGESAPSGPRLRRLLGEGLSFVAGFLVPVIGFAAWMRYEGALAAWIQGVFVAPTTWVAWAAADPVLLATCVGLIPAVLVLCLAGAGSTFARFLARYGSPVGLAALLVLAWRIPLVYLFLGESLPLVVPLLALLTLFVLGRVRPGEGVQGQRVFLLVAAAVCCALIQFPCSVQIYFYYVAPLVVLGALAFLSMRPGLDRVALGSLLAFYLAFGVWLRPPGYFQISQAGPRGPVVLATLRLPRGGRLLVPSVQAREYEELVSLVQAHSRGPFIYCTPDCPEVYFLSGKPNPTGTLWDFSDPDFLDLPSRTERVLSTVKDYGVAVVVLNGGSRIQSGPIPAELRSALDARFPESERIGNFDVRWRPKDSAP